MAIQIQLRQGTTTEHSTFTGAVGEVTVDTTKKTLVLHDGLTVGGTPLATSADLSTNIINYLPLAYPKSTPPQGYLAMMGQSISESTYPILYSLYGATLPDMRAYSVRGLDYGRGIDVDRTVLSQQEDAIRNITGSIGLGLLDSVSLSGAYQLTGWTGPNGGGVNGYIKKSATFDASRVVPVAAENRIKNIAFLYIVKAG